MLTHTQLDELEKLYAKDKSALSFAHAHAFQDAFPALLSLAREALAGSGECVWSVDEDGTIKTACGHYPNPYAETYCGNCGGKLIAAAPAP